MSAVGPAARTVAAVTGGAAARGRPTKGLVTEPLKRVRVTRTSPAPGSVRCSATKELSPATVAATSGSINPEQSTTSSMRHGSLAPLGVCDRAGGNRGTGVGTGRRKAGRGDLQPKYTSTECSAQNYRCPLPAARHAALVADVLVVPRAVADCHGVAQAKPVGHASEAPTRPPPPPPPPPPGLGSKILM